MPGRAPSITTSIVVMGVSGVGKTTVAVALAEQLRWESAEADSFHPPANIAKMTSGVPLTDTDREPWLTAIRDWITTRAAAGASVVVTCSALKRSYRDILRGAGGRVRFVHLAAPAELITERMTGRAAHFMPPSLLRSQLDDLEPLETDEDGIAVDASATPAEIVRLVLAHL